MGSPARSRLMITTIRRGSREEIEAVAAYVKELSRLAEDDRRPLRLDSSRLRRRGLSKGAAGRRCRWLGGACPALYN
jgi:hypothetical protein